METLKRNMVMATTHVDSHGEQLSKELLQELVERVNSDRKLRYGVEHRRDLPPIGRIEDAVLIERDGYHYVEANYFEYPKSDIVSWNKNLVIQYFEKKYPFIEVESEKASQNSVSVDYHNFGSQQELYNFKDSIQAVEELKFNLEYHVRKAQISDAEIIFKLVAVGGIYSFLLPTVKKIGEKASDIIVESSAKELKNAKKAIAKILKEAFYKLIPKSRPVAVVFDFPGQPHIELIARTREEELILKALSDHQLSFVKDEIIGMSKFIQIDKAQFLLSDKGKWKFNYLLTTTGDCIGKKEAINKRDRRIKMIRQNGGSGVSIGLAQKS